MVFELHGIKLWSVLCIVFYFFHRADGLAVGVLLGDYPSQEQRLLNSTISKKYAKGEIIFSANVQRVSEIDSFGASETLCEVLRKDNGVIAVFGPRYTPATAILESICLEFEIPYLSTSWRPSTQRDKGFFTNFFPESDYYAKALAEIVGSFGWKSFVVIYENDDTLLKFKNIFKLQKFNKKDKRNMITFEKLGAGPDHSLWNIIYPKNQVKILKTYSVIKKAKTDIPQPNLQLFQKVERSTQTNIILDCQTDLIEPLLRQAKNANLLNVYNNYFLANLDAYTLDYSELNTTANITTIRLFDDNDNNFKESVRSLGLAELIHYRKLKTDTALFYDALRYLHDTVKFLNVILPIPIQCNGTQKFRSGLDLSLNMKNRLPTTGLTGPIQFDDEGNRIDFNIYVVDVLHNKKIATWFEANQSLNVNSEIDETVTAVTNLQHTKVVVSSRLGAPYLMLEEVEEGSEKLTGNARYKGYVVDLIAQIAKIVGFEFEIVLTEDGLYGNYDEYQKKWTGLIGDILEKKAHLALCDLTITQERQDVVDFSLPFMELGIGILYGTLDYGETETFAFLNPFSKSLWMTILYAYIAISFCLYIVLRLSPDDWEKQHPCDELNDTLNNHWDLKNSLLLSLRALTMQGSDLVPKGKSARLAICMWWLFCLIITSSYIANLALIVNEANQESPINSVEDLASQTEVKFGMIKGGSTESFFQSSNNSIYQKMYYTIEQSPSLFTATNNEGVERVLSTENAQYAFLMESTTIEYVTQRNCELRQVGGLLDTKGYGIAMPQNAPYKRTINKAILELQEDGTLTELKRKWWMKEGDDLYSECETETSPSKELSPDNVKGLFIILGLGISIALAMAIFEFLWNVKKIAKGENVTFCETLCEELKLACYIWTNRRKIKN